MNIELYIFVNNLGTSMTVHIVNFVLLIDDVHTVKFSIKVCTKSVHFKKRVKQNTHTHSMHREGL